MQPETSVAEFVLFGAMLADLFAFGLLNTRLIRKILNGHSAFSQYGLSPMRGIDALKHAEFYLMLICGGFGFLIIMAISAKRGCNMPNEAPSFVKTTCALIAPFWAY